METSSILKTVLNQNLLMQQKPAVFRPGQIITGEISKLFPHQLAEVQVGSHKIIAKLEVPLSVNEKYWFQVQPGEGQIHLKMIAAIDDKGNQLNRNHSIWLLNQFRLPSTKENIQLINLFLKEQLPITKDNIQQAAVLLQDVKSLHSGLETIKLMVEKGLPFTGGIFAALLTAQEQEPIHLLMERLFGLLGEQNQSETSIRLINLLKNKMGIMDKRMTSLFLTAENGNLQNNEYSSGKFVWDDGKMVLGQLKQLIQTMGLGYEKELVAKGFEESSIDIEQALKPLLLQYLQEHPPLEGKETAEHLLNRITAQQLLSNDHGIIQQFVAQIPIHFSNSTSDFTIQWNGRRKSDGKIDPNYCRILFYLELGNIGDTLVDMQIQNRIMSISIVNDRQDLRARAESLIKPLKDQLMLLDYHLSSITFKQPTVSNMNPLEKKTVIQPVKESYYSGVDVRI